MEVIENATQLKARLLESSADPARPGWLRVSVEVRESSSLRDLPSLVHAGAGDTLVVLASPADRASIDALQPGADIALDVRLRAPGVYTAVPGSIGQPGEELQRGEAR